VASLASFLTYFTAPHGSLKFRPTIFLEIAELPQQFTPRQCITSLAASNSSADPTVRKCVRYSKIKRLWRRSQAVYFRLFNLHTVGGVMTWLWAVRSEVRTLPAIRGLSLSNTPNTVLGRTQIH
jgi:hypothetical protein